MTTAASPRPPSSRLRRANNIRVMTIEHYQPQTLAAAAQKIAALGDQIDALFIPEQADAMPAVSQALVTAGINGKKVQILGTGLWNDARVLKLPALQGAWFSAPENGGFNAFCDAISRQIWRRSAAHRDAEL